MDAVEDIKGRLSVEDVISHYVELKRAGRNFRGLSPFSNEKTPSFMVSPEKQIWHDFSSGKGGNMFSFVMEMEGLDFKGALELLARQAGVDLSQYSTGTSKQNSQQKERLYEAIELAAKFYQIHFSKNKTAYEYILKKRGFSKQTALDFRLGYSPNSDTSLTKFLTSKGFSVQELKRAGLVTQRYSGTSDMFRGRIMVPLMDQMGRVIGFTARLLDDDHSLSGGAPKYINTPATLLYDKSRHVFGLHLAKDAIRKGGYSVVVEGNMDVIASFQAEAKQTVATAGTAMTEMQLKALSRFAPDVRLAFDQDQAGLQAAERSIPLAAKVGISLSVITLKDAKDPDELIQKDPKAWQKAIDSPKYAVDWLIERYKGQIDIKTAPGKKQFTDQILKIVKNLPDSVEQDHYINEIAKLLSISADALRTKLTQTGSKEKNTLKRSTFIRPVLDNKEEIERIKTQNQLLALCLMVPETRSVIEIIKPTMLPEANAQKLLGSLQTAGGEQHDTLPTLKDYVKMLVLLYEETYQGLDTLELKYEAERLQKRLIDQHVKIQKILLAGQLRDANEKQTGQLLEQAKELDSLLKEVSNER